MMKLSLSLKWWRRWNPWRGRERVGKGWKKRERDGVKTQ